MRRQKHNAEFAGEKAHRKLLCRGHLGQKLGVAQKVVAAQADSLFADWGRTDRVYLAFAPKLDGGFNIFGGRLARHRLIVAYVETRSKIREIDNFDRIRRNIVFANIDDLEARHAKVCERAEKPGVAYDHASARSSEIWIEQG